MGMYDCEKCLHEEMCDQPGRHLWGTLNGEKECSDFKDRDKYVEVVRCKDCTQWCRNIGIADSPNGHCYYHEIEMNGFDFCSYGERKDND